MKRFEFSLEKLLSVKEQLAEKEKLHLAQLRQQKANLAAQREQLDALYAQKSTDLYALLQKGALAIEVAQQKRFIAIKQQEIKRKQLEIDRKEEEIQRQLQAVLEVNREVETIQRLKDAQYAEYQDAERKEQEAFIEEFVRNSKAREVQA